MTSPFSVAIDGPSGAGKSTIARELARATGALHLDTGAMYRVIGLWLLRHGIDPRDAERVAQVVGSIDVGVAFDGGKQRMLMSGEDVTDAIRTGEVSMAASAASAVPAVRERMVAMQQAIAAGQDVVMDGRDIGTKVLPNATLKIFLVAAPEERARRRYLELQEKGTPEPFDKVLHDLIERDLGDTTRAASPLTKTEDAIELDSSELSREETVARALTLLKARLED